MPYRTPTKRQRAWSGALWLLGLCSLVTTLVWPPVLEHIAHSRWVLGLFTAWCFAFSGYLNGALSAFAEGIREGWSKDDDDDDFHAA